MDFDLKDFLKVSGQAPREPSAEQALALSTPGTFSNDDLWDLNLLEFGLAGAPAAAAATAVPIEHEDPTEETLAKIPDTVHAAISEPAPAPQSTQKDASPPAASVKSGEENNQPTREAKETNSLNVSVEKTNYARYLRLLMDVGKEVLLSIFKASYQKQEKKPWTDSSGQKVGHHLVVVAALIYTGIHQG
jgi:hypothetical protein